MIYIVFYYELDTGFPYNLNNKFPNFSSHSELQDMGFTYFIYLNFFLFTYNYCGIITLFRHCTHKNINKAD